MIWRSGTIRFTSKAIAGALLVALTAGCSGSTIHTESNIGGVDTLSIDAKQRLVFVGERAPDRLEPAKRVTCTEPMPDALVAQAAVIAASGNVTQTGGPSGGGGISGGLSESAGSIGYRDHTIQMLRDGYYRLCEAYLNGAISKTQYQHMVLNADTFMVVISALQVIGSNQAAPAITLTPAATTATVNKEGVAEVKSTPTDKPQIQNVGNGKPATEANAKVARQIVNDYLKYRAALVRYQDTKEARQRQQWRRNKRSMSRGS